MRSRILTVVLGAALASAVHAGSETPPKGPPWERDLLKAQKQALEEGRPLFLYFTKTY